MNNAADRNLVASACGVRAHLHDRKISLQDLNQLRVWIDSKPNVPEGPWYKDFGSFKLGGEGRYPKRFFSRAKLLQDRNFSTSGLKLS